MPFFARRQITCNTRLPRHLDPGVHQNPVGIISTSEDPTQQKIPTYHSTGIYTARLRPTLVARTPTASTVTKRVAGTLDAEALRYPNPAPNDPAHALQAAKSTKYNPTMCSRRRTHQRLRERAKRENMERRTKTVRKIRSLLRPPLHECAYHPGVGRKGHWPSPPLELRYSFPREHSVPKGVRFLHRGGA